MDFPGFDDLKDLSEWVSLVVATYAVPAGAEVLKKLKDKASEAVVRKVTAKAGQVWGWLKNKFAGDPAGKLLLENLAADPESAEAQRDLASFLELQAKCQPDVLEALRPMLEELKDLLAELPATTVTQYAPQKVKQNGDQNISVQIQGNGSSSTVNR